MSKKYTLNLSHSELEYVRDIFSVFLDQEVTISQRLSLLTERAEAENTLWKKIYKLCEGAEIPVGDSAPNYIISLSDCPLDIFKAEFQNSTEESFLNNLGKENKNETKSGTKNISSTSKKDKNNAGNGNRRNNKKKSSRRRNRVQD